jgi:hypothetical protein
MRGRCDLVSELAIAHHARAAYRGLRDCGRDALPAVRQGLMHPSANVRYWCCQYLDLVPDVMDELVAMLDDLDNRVRMALHALDDWGIRKTLVTSMRQRSCLVPSDEGSAIRAVAVADQVAWRLVPAAGLGQPTGKPFRVGMGCHTQPQKLAA